MKINELYRSGFSDGEGDEPHSRSSAQVTAEVSFAHETGLESAFAQLQELPQFKEELEKEFARLYHKVAQQFLRQSQVPAGYGWMDDYEVSVEIVTRHTQQG